jgi:hypothetical protein
VSSAAGPADADSGKLPPGQRNPTGVQLRPVCDSDTVAPNTKFKFTTVVSGGEPPYQFDVGLAQEPPEMTGHVGEGGGIAMEVTAPRLVDNKEKTVQVKLQVLDANGRMGKQSTKVTVKPSP